MVAHLAYVEHNRKTMDDCQKFAMKMIAGKAEHTNAESVLLEKNTLILAPICRIS